MTRPRDGELWPRRRGVTVAAALLAVIVLAIATVLAVEAAGYPPCELCLKERVPYYAGAVLAAAALLLAARGPVPLARGVLALIAIVFVASAAFGAYHAGVEWGLWSGPTDCTGTPARAATSADFLNQLREVHVVRCDAAAVRVLGISLAGWNAVASLAIAGLALAGTRMVPASAG